MFVWQWAQAIFTPDDYRVYALRHSLPENMLSNILDKGIVEQQWEANEEEKKTAT